MDGEFVYQCHSSHCDPANLTFRANQPEMGKVISSSKNPRKLMRPWQRQEGQL